MPTKNNLPPAGDGGPDRHGSNAGGDPPIFTLLRQYLTMLTGRDPVEEVHKNRKARVSRKQGKVYVKKMKVRMEKDAKPSPKKVPVTELSDAAMMPELERSLQQYISRRQAALSRYAVKTKPSEVVVPDFPKQAEKKADAKTESAATEASPASTAAAPTPNSWKRFVQLLPFVSEAVVDTAERTEKLEKTMAKNTAQTQEMSRRLKEAESLLGKQIKAAEPKATQASRAMSKAEREQLQNNLGRIQSAEKEVVESGPQEVITKADMGGLRKAKDTSTFGVTQKKESFFSSLFGGFREAAADISEVNREAKQTKTAAAAAAAAPAPKQRARALPTPQVTEQRDRGSLLVKNSAVAPPAPTKPVVDTLPVAKEEKKAPDTSALGDLVSSFSGKTLEKGPVRTVAEATADRKKEQQVHKEKMDSEEKRAEYMMMSAAKPKHKEAGFFTQLNASLQYMGMGKERLAIVQNLATMLNAGLPLIDSLKTLQMETRNRATKKLLAKINTAVDNGSSLWRAMDDQHFFSPHAIALIRIGEEAGNLAQNMEYLAAQQEQDQGLREKVKMAMIYPAIVLVMMFIVVMGLGLFVLPQLVQVLFNLNVQLPLITRIVIAFSNGFSQNGHIVVPGILLGVIFLTILGKFTRFKVVVQWIIFKIPGIGPLARQATLARFGVILGGLLEAGVPLVEAMRSLVDVTPIVSYKRFYRRLLEHVTIGDSFAKSFGVIPSTNRLFPISMQQLIITGERTGSLSKIMLKVAAIYEKEANNTAQKLPVILEPMLLLFIGGLVGTIAFAIIIPIYSVVGNVSK